MKNRIVIKSRALLIAISLLGAAAVYAQQSQPPAPPPAPPSAQLQPQQPGAIVRSVNLVDVLFSVVTKQGKLVTDLTQGDFKVFDNGVQQQITAFAQPTDLPLRIGMVLDTSNSIRERLKFEQDAAINFLFDSMRRDRDQAFLMTFDNGPELIKPFTGNTGDLRDTILKQRAAGGTALYDAVYAASQQLLTAPLPAGPNPDVRRVLVIISDGDDNSSTRSLDAAVEMAQRAGVIIYAVSTSNEWIEMGEIYDSNKPNKAIDKKYSKNEGDVVLEQLALETGGRSFFPYQVDDLGQSFMDIGDELRHQYALAYTPVNPPDGKFHSIRIQVSRKGLKMRARKGYYSLLPEPAAGLPPVSPSPASGPAASTPAASPNP